MSAARPLAVAAVLAALAASGPARGQGAAPPDARALFEELQVSRPNGFPAYDLDRLGGPAGAVRVTLDPGNGYLRIDDAGQGGGVLVTELALWLDADGAPLAGLAERLERDGAPVAGRVRFFSRASGRWNSVTREVWPPLEASLCGAPAPAAEEDAEEDAAGDATGGAIGDAIGADGLGPMAVRLPRTGVGVEVVCVPASPAAGRTATLEWNAAAGRFQMAGPPAAAR